MSEWIDEVARAMASGSSRRTILRRVGGGLAGVVLASLVPATAFADKEDKDKNKDKEHGNGKAENQGDTNQGTNQGTNHGDNQGTNHGDNQGTNHGDNQGNNQVRSLEAGPGNSFCAQWCHDNRPDTSVECTSQAAQGFGPCFEENSTASRCGDGRDFCDHVCCAVGESCVDGHCRSGSCTPHNRPCSSDAQCCSGLHCSTSRNVCVA